MQVHVIGGGLAGLAAAVELVEAGRRVTLYEAGPACGGRCRSFHDRALDARIDNGNHLLLSGNREVFDYLGRLGTADTMAGPGAPIFPFVDLGTGERWTLRLARGRIPWWLASPRTRVPGTTLGEYAALFRLLAARPGMTVADCLRPGALAHRLLEPLAIAVLNTMPAEGSAALLGAVFRETLLAGGSACIPAFPRIGLSETFVDPAVARLAVFGAEVRTGCRVAGLTTGNGRVTGFAVPGGEVMLADGDRVVLATPAPVAADLVPGLAAPDAFEAIANVHFRMDAAPVEAGGAEAGFVGLVGGLAEWVFVKPGIVSVTISAANRFEATSAETLTARVWGEVRAALRLAPGTPAPPSRLLREKRATFAATERQEKLRPGTHTDLTNLVLAGDWVRTGLPATIEGAIKSGRAAADTILKRGPGF